MEDKCSVWVGSLPLKCKEETLSEYFGKFGPLKSVVVCRDELGKSKRFGYVNYFGREIAECAASVMDGFQLFNQSIKTKGPNELEALKNVQNTSAKTDYRSITDCLYFVDGRQCTWKEGECIFRHCEEAKKTTQVCEKWQQKQCKDELCPLRHPRLTKSSMITLDGALPLRCPSHNAFKCFGECGNKDCNTHFLDHAAYVEHVTMAKTNLAQPVDKCIKCQAVFFNHEEKTNHRCYKDVLTNPPPPAVIPSFTSTRVQAEKDIVQPRPLYPTKSSLAANNPSFNYTSHPNVKSQQSSLFFSSTKPFANLDQSDFHCPEKINAQKNSTLFQSFPPKPIQFSTTFFPQKDPNFVELRTSLKNQENAMKEFEPVGVFWDFENCAIPRGKSARAVVQKIRSVFLEKKREAEFMCVCDTGKEKKTVIEELNQAQVTVVHINATSKNAADDKLRQSLRRFAQTYDGRAATVVLISGDGNFAMDLSDLKHRYNFRVICLHNESASSALLGFAHEAHRFDLLTQDLQNTTTIPVIQQSPTSKEVLITNLPPAKQVLLKAKLSKLSDNCGGKVVKINGNKAVLHFPNAEAASRARRRLDKEELFGYILLATLLPATNFKNGSSSVTQKPSSTMESFSYISPAVAGVRSPAGVHQNSPYSPKFCKENQSPNTNISSRTESLIRNTRPLRFTDARPQMSLPFQNLPFTGQQIHSPYMFNNMFRPGLVHGMLGMRACRPLSPLNMSTRPTSLPVAPMPLFAVADGLARRSPSPEQQFSGADLLVTNLNESEPKEEITKKLASVFREHCKVYSVVLHAKNGEPLRAFVKVPQLIDAHMVIPKVNGKIVFGRNMNVSLANEKEKELCYLQLEAVTVLLEAPLCWLPLATFFSNFEKKYRRNLDSRHFDEIKDSVVINRRNGRQAISLVEGKIELEKVVVDSKTFTADVFKLLDQFDGVIALVSFPALYWLEFRKEIKSSPTGALLVEVLCGIPNVTVVGTGTKQNIQWIKKPGKTSTYNSSQLPKLREQIVEILQDDHEFEMTFERLKEKYLNKFERTLDPSLFGFNSLSDLLHSMSSILQTKEDTTGKHVHLLRELRVDQFKKEVFDLLSHQPCCSVLLSNFMASYVKHFGKKFTLSSFGYNRLPDLIKAFPSVAEIEGVGDQRTVKLIEFDEKQRLKETSVDTPDQSPSQTVEDIKKRLLTLIKEKDPKLILVKDIAKLYHDRFNQTLFKEHDLLEKALQSLDKPLEVRGVGSDRVVGVFTHPDHDNDNDFVFVKSAIDVLYHSKDFSLPKAKFNHLYQLNVLKNENIDKKDRRLHCLPSCVVLHAVGADETVLLRRSTCIRLLVEELRHLLTVVDDRSMKLDEIPSLYNKHFGRGLNLEAHGVTRLTDIENSLNGSLEMNSVEADVVRISLSPIARFEIETQNLLRANDGCLSFCRFAPAYNKFYGKPCIVSEYGFSKLFSLVHAVPHVARLSGSGPEKFIIAVDRSIPERIANENVIVQSSSDKESFFNDVMDVPGNVEVSNLSYSVVEKSTSSKSCSKCYHKCRTEDYKIKNSREAKKHSLEEETHANSIVEKGASVGLKADQKSPCFDELNTPASHNTAKSREKNGGVNPNTKTKLSKSRLAANFSLQLQEKR
ncbi:meiosis regulator and mRNA stability factor 1-like isoform X2 [Xenia sp. Carnegie-2017]|uniref:meiosis regulator and mRNA stability factor 1-like isoform X2 n=1 Tax=Xenia sp. Carnegie-2017 TaxID=2897299 RepID=UPI001F033946|nr:meiosis regulator and mRNA stability factor 1-like isoform X2 [Xenia sp. Carnegie-2017]